MSANPILKEKNLPSPKAAHEAVTVALKELFRLVRVAHEPRTPKEERITKVAKAICESKRVNADQITTGHPNHPCLAGNNAVAIVYPIQPAWATYWVEAIAAIDAVDEVRLCAQD
jgi:hypothetical protein